MLHRMKTSVFIATRIKVGDTLVDSKEALKDAGIQVRSVARDPRFYDAVLPDGWVMKPYEASVTEFIDEANDIRFTQYIDGVSFNDSKVYLEPAAQWVLCFRGE